MKKTILLASIFAVGAAVAAGENGGTVEVEGQNAIGILEVAASAKPTTVLLSVPFAGYGEAGNTLMASELVATDTLPAGTKLRVAVETVGDYYTWNLTSGKTWEPVNAVTIGKDGEREIVTPAANTIPVGRGNSFWLVLPAAPGAGAKITLVGQQDASTTNLIPLSGGKWNLVGNPNVADFNVAGKIAELTKGDQISVQNGDTGKLKTFVYNGLQWIYARQTFDVVSLAPGDGCWIYVQSDNATLSF